MPKEYNNSQIYPNELYKIPGQCITQGDFENINFSYKFWNGYLRHKFGKKAIKQFKDKNEHIIAHLSGHQDEHRFTFIPYHTNSTLRKNPNYEYAKIPMLQGNYNNLLTIKPKKRFETEKNTHDLTDLMKEANHNGTIFIGISSINTPYKPGDEHNTIAYMSYGIDRSDSDHK